ncbi:MAG: DUF1015 domain-containing protein [Clostridia bacterium]|nr:DUF1015 domain-containing protein [Clostridia bacterium]
MSASVFSPADLLLPKKDFESWSVIACDQYTSEPEYWETVRKTVGDKPSALQLILPEVYLSDDNTAAIDKINRQMAKDLEDGIFEEIDNALIYVERRQSDGKIRHGLVGKIDLAQYDFRKGATAAIRATEETVLERIPPRVKIRENAPLELPHVLLLADDPENMIFAALSAQKSTFRKVYDFDLMQNGGHITGYLLDDSAASTVLSAMDSLQTAQNGLLFCVGDGNHSLATAKTCYEQNPNEQNRYALVEVVNIHDAALEFEPIYRVVFGVDPEALINEFVAYCGADESGQQFTCVYGTTEKQICVSPKANLCVGTLQGFLDGYLKAHPECKIDYIHGIESTRKLCEKENTVGFIFDGMQKQELFPAVRADGSLPRKTFSMGHADDKRFYLEARKIR